MHHHGEGDGDCKLDQGKGGEIVRIFNRQLHERIDRLEEDIIKLRSHFNNPNEVFISKKIEIGPGNFIYEPHYVHVRDVVMALLKHFNMSAEYIRGNESRIELKEKKI